MKRTQIYLTEEEKKAIENLSDERGTTQSYIIREAIDEYLTKEKAKPKNPSWILPAYGRKKRIFLMCVK